jgi:hypothetical protein
MTDTSTNGETALPAMRRLQDFGSYQPHGAGFTVAPMAIIPLWLVLRLQTPRDGLHVTTIRAAPGAVALLSFMAAALITMTLLCALDMYVFGRPFRAPLEPYHAALFAPPFIIMFAGACRADRIAKAQKAGHGVKGEDPHAA